MSLATALGARVLRGLDPETAHNLALLGLRAGMGPRAAASDPILATRLAELSLPNPIGLAAGFDKNAAAARALLRAGFGFVECGTTTPRHQAGNPKPRLFRLAEDGAVINRMGFNNAGFEAFAAGVVRAGEGVVGANIGANKDSEDRAGDYVAGLNRLWGLAAYFTLNVSSPNTPGLRGLQARGALDDMLGRVAEARARLASGGADHPVFLKVAPDLVEGDVEAITESSVSHGLQGVIVANTTLARADSLAGAAKTEIGGLSGRPLMARSTQLLRLFFEAAAGRLALIGVGGVGSGADALAKIRAGADAVQLYTALVYGGPGLVIDIGRDLAARLRAEGFASVAQAVGTA